MNVSACLVTRGNVDMKPVFDSLPAEWEIVIWDNARGWASTFQPEEQLSSGSMGRQIALSEGRQDLSVYGRYAAIAYASHELIYVQDDDAIVSDPQALVDAWVEFDSRWPNADTPFVVCNMPQRFRHDFYTRHALVGFGGVFHRDAPTRAFDHFHEMSYDYPAEEFNATCDIILTALLDRVLVDVPHEDREFASDPDRMWRQPTHQSERKRMLELALRCRDA